MFQWLLLSGFITFTLSVPRQYVFVNEPKTWAEAQRYCRDKYADLATIENEQQTVQLLDTVTNNSIDLAWIGLYDDLNSWKWTLENTDFFKAGEKDFRNWYNPVPYQYGGQNMCVYIYSGIWYTAPCSYTLYPTVCYDGRKNASATYVFVYQSKNWTEAQSYCRQYHTDLISIRTETENLKIHNLLRNNFNYYYSIWIGLYRTRSWSDQSNSSFSFWSPWQPDMEGSCTVVSFNDFWKWKEEYCNYAFPFICYNVSSFRQYYFVNESKSWTEAQKFCRQNYTDLATIVNIEEMNRLIDTVNGSYNGSAWIGLYDDVNSWRWSLQDSDFYQVGEKDFRNFYHEPNNYGGTELCVYMNYEGKWYDISCENTTPFVCYDGENATNSYIRINDYKTWTEARRYCRDHYTDLVNVRNQTENQKILETLGGEVWIGLYRNRIWSDQQISSYENWKPAIPYSSQQPDNGQYDYDQWDSQFCTAVSFSHSGRWTDENCSFNMPFICYNKICTQSSCTRQYYFLSESKSWTEAQSFCRHNYTDLATIDNMEEMNRLFKSFRGTYNGKAWIGLYDDVNSWKWSLDNAALDGFKHWYVQQPMNWGGQSLCVYMSYNQGIWNEAYCSNTFPFVCYDGRVNASTNYVFINQYKNWSEAQSYCRQHHTDLVSIRNDTENFKLHSLLRNYNYYYYYNVWIGLYRSRSWSDQSNSSFSNWRSGQPDNAGYSQHCTGVSFSDSGSWTDENCNIALPYICYSALASFRQFYFMNESKNWTEAQRFCRENYTDLATIENMEEMNRLIDTVNGTYNGSAWIGLYDDVNSWRWSLQDNVFYQEGERDFRNWYHQPENRSYEMCVYMDYKGNWFDSSCDYYNTFVCYNGLRNSSQKYVWVYEGRTWAGAQSYCREKYTDLASVKNETDWQQILHIIRINSYNWINVWIGLHRTSLWSDQSNSSFTYWLPWTGGEVAQPDNGYNVLGKQGAQHCTAVSLTHFGQWTDEFCFDSLPFFCYSDKYVMGLRVEFTSLEDLSKSQIEQLVIKQLQEELQKRGAPSNVTMHLRYYYKIKP